MVVCKFNSQRRMSALLLAPVFILVGLANTSTHSLPASDHPSTSITACADVSSQDFSEMTRLNSNRMEKISGHSMLHPVYADMRILFVHLKIDDTGGSASLSHFQLGYGDIFPLNTIATTSSNGAGWEEPNYGYVKYCRSF